MIKHNQDGGVSGVGISLILSVLLLIGAVAFGAWAFTSRQDYKQNVDHKITDAVVVAKQQEDTIKEKDFVQREKFPLRTYTGPETYGSLIVQFPKTWSGQVDETGVNQALVDGYFAPNIVPSITNQGSTFALRIQVVQQAYSDVVKQLTGQETDPTRPLTIEPYALPKLPKVVGVKASGNISSTKTGEMIVLPLRANTLEVWTEGTNFTSDFENIILPNFTFSP